METFIRINFTKGNYKGYYNNSYKRTTILTKDSNSYKRTAILTKGQQFLQKDNNSYKRTAILTKGCCRL